MMTMAIRVADKKTAFVNIYSLWEPCGLASANNLTFLNLCFIGMMYC